MKEVSCRAFGIYFRDLKRKGIPAERIVEGVGLTVAHLQNSSERVDWDQFRAVMANCSQIWSEEELIGLGGAFFRDPRMAPLSLIARILFDARDFYAWMCKERDGAGQILFTCVRSSFHDTGRGTCEIHLTMHDGYMPSREFFLVSLGSMRDGPRILMLPSAKVEMVDEGQRVVYRIEVPQGGGILRRIRKALLAPFTGHAIARELSTANAVLEERYQQLEIARQQLDTQATQLRVANEVGQLIHADLDLDRTLKRVSEALVSVAKFSRARLDISFASSDARIQRQCEAGVSQADHKDFRLELAARGVSLGTLELWSPPAAQRAKLHDPQLFEHILPSICLAIDEAIAFSLLSEYRINLEQRVADRTYELRTARDSLAQTVKDLEEAQAVRNRIFSNINHEIRTPLALVLLAAGEIRARRINQHDPKTESSVANIEAACERLLSMVDSMLILAAGQEGKLKIHRRGCDIAIETRRLVSFWAPLAREHKLTLTYQGPERLEAYVDTAALERVLANLISNAIKYTPDSGAIELALAGDANKVEIFVRDTGIGIDDEFKKRIFGRFEQGRAAVRHGARSTGIGLSIVKELMQAHDGTVTVDSNRGGGTVFHLIFPAVPADQRVDTPAEAAPFSGPALPAGFGLHPINENAPSMLVPEGSAHATILVAEDDNSLRTSIGELLRDAGYKVLLAADGFAALRLAGEHYPDMLVSDVGMPGMDGLTLSRRFRELPGNRLAPVVLLTAYGTTTDKLSGFRAGAIDYVTKPFEPKELVARVESQLKLRDMALRLSRSEKLASLGTMSAGLAHEMRNPANGLLNALDPLVGLLPAAFTTSDSDTGQLIDVIRDCAQQIGRLSKQLLGFRNEGAITCTDENVQHMVKRALSMVEAKRGRTEVRVRHAYGNTVRCAAPMLLQVLVNLLDNALDAAGKDGWVEITTRVDGQSVIFDVRDSGEGVPPELRERIFEPFFTTKAPGAGTGLGLSTSRRIIEQHQGTLRVVEDTHSTFRVELPLNGPEHGAVAVGGHEPDQLKQAVAS